MPQVSVIVPFYNEEQHLESCLSSLLQQSFQDFEVLLIDDQSTDSSFLLAQRLTASDARFHLYHNEQKGLFNARNKALSLAQGDYICFVDADDEASAEYLLALVSQAERYHPDLVVQGFMHIVRDQAQLRLPASEGFFLIHRSPQVVFSSFDVNHLGNLFGKLYRRTVIMQHDLRFSSHVQMSEDQFFVLSYLCHCQSVYLSRQYNYRYIIRSQSMSNSYWPFQTEWCSYRDLDRAWQQLIDTFPCLALEASYGVFVGNYTHRLVYAHAAHPASSGCRPAQQWCLEHDCYPAFRRYHHPQSLFQQALRWTALHGLYGCYRWLMQVAIIRYHLIVNFA